ncbi:MAG: transglutaminase family protein [Candidatus Ornithospirochaeta sp.]
MKKLSLSYSLSFSFEKPVVTSHFRFKGIPSTEIEEVVSSSYSILPSSWTAEDKDVFGNTLIYGSYFGETESLTLSVDLSVEKREREKRVKTTDPIYLYSSPSTQTKMGPNLESFYSPLKERGSETNLERAIYFMNALSSSFIYQKGETKTDTDAEEAFTIQKGVCQDYSHIMLSLLRREGIPSRYCCGVFLDGKESHAWIEVLSDGIWVGLDPANSKLIDDNYILLALGQDSKDTLLNKGIFFGGGRQEMKMNYRMVEQ